MQRRVGERVDGGWVSKCNQGRPGATVIRWRRSSARLCHHCNAHACRERVLLGDTTRR